MRKATKQPRNPGPRRRGRSRLWVPGLLVGLLALGGCEVTELVGPDEDYVPQLTPVQDSLFILTNRARAAHGVREFELSGRLTEMATAHARDMAERNFISHTTPDGKTFEVRLAEFEVGSRPAGENIAAEFSARGAVDGWLGSEDHRANLLDPAYGKVGIGVVRDEDGPYIFYVEVYTR